MPALEAEVPYEPKVVIDHFMKKIAASAHEFFIKYSSEGTLIYAYKKDINWVIFILLLWLCIIPAIIYAIVAGKSGSASVHVSPVNGKSHVVVTYQGKEALQLARQALQELRAYETPTTDVVRAPVNAQIQEATVIEASLEGEESVTCANCGSPVAADDTFCVSCGTKL